MCVTVYTEQLASAPVVTQYRSRLQCLWESSTKSSKAVEGGLQALGVGQEVQHIPVGRIAMLQTIRSMFAAAEIALFTNLSALAEASVAWHSTTTVAAVPVVQVVCCTHA